MVAEEKELQDGWKRVFVLAKKFQSGTLPDLVERSIYYRQPNGLPQTSYRASNVFPPRKIVGGYEAWLLERIEAAFATVVDMTNEDRGCD